MIAVIQKAMKILSVLADGKGAAISLRDISEKTGYPKPTCSRILSTLCEDGYTVRVSHTEGYRAGPSLYYLTRYGRYEEGFVALAAPVVRWLEKKSHATVVLSVIQSGRKYIIDYADKEQRLFDENTKIRLGDIYRTATGRAILAHMSEPEVREIYARHGNPKPHHWERVNSYESLLSALLELRGKRVIVSDAINGDKLERARGYASPIFRGDVCVGAIGIALDATALEALTSERDTEIRLLLEKGAREIRRRLEYEV